MSQYVGKAPKEQQANRLDEIRSAMNSYVEKNNKGLYGNIDITTMNNKLRVSQGMSSSFSGVLGRGMDAAADALYNPNPSLAPHNSAFPFGVL